LSQLVCLLLSLPASWLRSSFIFGVFFPLSCGRQSLLLLLSQTVLPEVPDGTDQMSFERSHQLFPSARRPRDADASSGPATAGQSNPVQDRVPSSMSTFLVGQECLDMRSLATQRDCRFRFV
jgi:hypothetical protein